MNEQEQLTSFEILRKLNLSEEMVRAHVVLPHHIKDASISIEALDPARRPSLTAVPPSGWFYRLDVKGLNRDLQAVLNKCLVGYSLQLRRNDRVVLSQQWGNSKTLPDGNVSWTSSVPLHLASVSKMITAMAMTKLLGNMRISPDTPIATWLPYY
jgi:CubicO group peptidase (beta-lactamase class C family)